jgi:hypothetical protein
MSTIGLYIELQNIVINSCFCQELVEPNDLLFICLKNILIGIYYLCQKQSEFLRFDLNENILIISNILKAKGNLLWHEGNRIYIHKKKTYNSSFNIVIFNEKKKILIIFSHTHLFSCDVHIYIYIFFFLIWVDSDDRVSLNTLSLTVSSRVSKKYNKIFIHSITNSHKWNLRIVRLFLRLCSNHHWI